MSEVERLRNELAAARRTIEVLMDRAESALMVAAPEDVALQQAIAGLESKVRQQAGHAGVAEADYRRLFEAHPDSLMLVDGGRRIRACNAQAARLLEDTAEKLQGGDFCALVHEEERRPVAAFLEGVTAEWQHRVVRMPDGRFLTLGCSAMDDGELLVSLRSMSDAHRLGEELSQARRLAGVGRLAGDLVRALADPLSMVDMGLTMLLLSDLSPGAAAIATKVQRDLGGVSDIARDLLNFVEVGELAPELEQAAAVFADVLGELARRRPAALVEIEQPEVPLAVYADPRRLRQLLVHLVIHALDGAPSDRAVQLGAARGPAGLEFWVRRPGRGLSPSERDSRSPLAGEEGWEQPDGMGFSLGLAWMLTQQHGGTLTASDTLLDGAVYTVRLGLSPAASVPPVAMTGRRVLVVDDDPLLGPVLLSVLEEGGHRPRLAASAEEALRILSAGGVEALVTDISLPGIDGETLAEQVVQAHPHLRGRVLITSGRLSSPRLDVPYLQKPFSSDALRAAVTSMFEVTQP